MLCEKYRAACFADIKGQEDAISSLKAIIKEGKKAIILHGPSGAGKTSLAYALAYETQSEILELNASDLRNREQLEKIIRPAIEQQSLFAKSKKKVILVDEIDGLSHLDRGGVSELLSLIETTNFPIIMTSNDIWQQKFSQLRKKATLIELKELSYSQVADILNNIIKKENISIESNFITKIAIKSKGDVRAAINDLEIAHQNPSLLESMHREEKNDIFNVMRTIFKSMPKTDETKDIQNTQRIYDTLDMNLDEIFLWIEENIPYEYSGEELANAFDKLSKADVFRGRIYRQQYWRFLVYENLLLSVGISAAKKQTKEGFTKYKKPTRILKIWLNNQKNAKKKAIAAKFAKIAHISVKRAMKDFFLLPYMINQNQEAASKLKLTEDEIDFLKERVR